MSSWCGDEWTESHILSRMVQVALRPDSLSVFRLYFHIVFIIREVGLAKRTYMNIPNTAWLHVCDGYVGFLVYPSISHELRVLTICIHSCVWTTWTIITYEGDNLSLPREESPGSNVILWGHVTLNLAALLVTLRTWPHLLSMFFGCNQGNYLNTV